MVASECRRNLRSAEGLVPPLPCYGFSWEFPVLFTESCPHIYTKRQSLGNWTQCTYIIIKQAKRGIILPVKSKCHGAAGFSSITRGERREARTSQGSWHLTGDGFVSFNTATEVMNLRVCLFQTQGSSSELSPMGNLEGCPAISVVYWLLWVECLRQSSLI